MGHLGVWENCRASCQRQWWCTGLWSGSSENHSHHKFNQWFFSQL